MKKYILWVLVIFIASPGFCQSLLADEDVVWFGIDYSNARAIGAEGFSQPDELVDYYLDEWNALILRESDKYNVSKFYRKGHVFTDLTVVEERNDIPEPDEFIIDEDYSFGADQLKDIIKSYSPEKHNKGLGLVYVVESLNKRAEKGNIHVVFFDIATKEILWTKKYSQPAGGFGFRNYWLKPIFLTMEESSKDFKKVLKNL